MRAAPLMRLMQGGEPHAVLDVRERGEAEGGHLAGATVMPRRLLESLLPELVPARDTPVVFTDDDGWRAALAARSAAEMGYSAADWLEGGIAAWREAGGAVSRGSNVPGKRFGEQLARAGQVPQLSAAMLRQWLDERRNVLVCDARTPAEYRAATIPGAVSVPSFDLAAHAGRLLQRHDALIVSCAGRTRSLLGTRTLVELGHDRVFALENGTMGWALAGERLEKDARRSLAPADEADEADAEARARRWAQREGVELVAPGKLAARLGSAAAANERVLDVRSVDEFARGHIPGAIPVPSGQLVQRCDDFIALRHASVVLADRREARAIAAAIWLKRMDWGRPLVLEGGMQAWIAAGHATGAGRRRHGWWGFDDRRAAVRVIDAPELNAELRRGEAFVVSVDSSSRFRARHVPGAAWLPRSRLEERADRVIADRARPVVVTCADGIQSVYAAVALERLGYDDVRVLDGGVGGWSRRGLPEESGGDIDDDGDMLTPPYARGDDAMRAYLEWEQRL